MVEKIIKIKAPAKINLMLAITGKRKDGYHDLVSVVMQLPEFFDLITLSLNNKCDQLILEESEIKVPLGKDNLIMKAVNLLRQRIPFTQGITISLMKNIPTGAGLGGGSSDVVAVLKGVNQLLGNKVSIEVLKDIAHQVGSDCALFFEKSPVVIKGKGELLSYDYLENWKPFCGQKILLFKPEYGVNTAWAYGKIKQYTDFSEAERCVCQAVLMNDFERVVFQEHKELRELVCLLNNNGHQTYLTGSGSACFVFAQGNSVEIRKIIKKYLGEKVFMIETVLEDARI